MSDNTTELAGKKYIRDKRSPVPKHAAVSRVMSANKAKDTKPEIAVRKLLWNNGIRGYRLNWKKVPGRPDIAFPGKKLAIFVHGCFWHRCPICTKTLPKHNTQFWQDKFDKNVARDAMKVTQLEQMDWRVITVWECQLKESPEQVLESIKNELGWLDIAKDTQDNA